MEKLILLSILLSAAPLVQLDMFEDSGSFELKNNEMPLFDSEDATPNISVSVSIITVRGTFNGSYATTYNGQGTAIKSKIDLWNGITQTNVQNLQFVWTKNDIPLSYFNHTMLTSVECTSSILDPGYCTIFVNFTDITMFDTGTYKCTVMLGSRELISWALYIRVFAKPDIILYNYYVERDETAEINYTCAITNYQYVDPTIQYAFDWRISGNLVNHSVTDIEHVLWWQDKLVTSVGHVFMKNVSCEISGCPDCGITSMMLNFKLGRNTCEGEYLQGSYWPTTSEGESVKVPCPIGYSNYAGYWLRECYTNGKWGDPEMSCLNWISDRLINFLYYDYPKYTILDVKSYIMILDMIEQSIPKRWIGTTAEIEIQIINILDSIEFGNLQITKVNDMKMMKGYLLAIFRILDKLVLEQFNVGLKDSYQGSWNSFRYSVYNLFFFLPMKIRKLIPIFEYRGSYADFFVINETLECTNQSVDVRIPFDENFKPFFQSNSLGCGKQVLVIKYKYIQSISYSTLKHPLLGNWSIVSDVISLYEIESNGYTSIDPQQQIRTLFFDIVWEETGSLMCVDLGLLSWNRDLSVCNTSIISPNSVACLCKANSFRMIAVVNTDSESNAITYVPTQTSTPHLVISSIKNITDVHSLWTALDTVEKLDLTENKNNSSLSTSTKVDFLQQISLLNISFQSVDSAEHVTKKFVSVVDNLLDDTYDFTDQKIENVEQSMQTASTILNSVDNFGRNVLQSLKTNQHITVTKPNIVISIQRTKPKTIVFPDATITGTGDDTKFTLPKETLDNIYTNEDDTVGFTAVKYSSLGEALKSTDKNIQKDREQTVNSAILSLTLQSKHKILNPPIDLQFQHLKTNLSNPICSFWDFTKSQWSSEGCKVIRMELNVTTCSCNHLTNFAILMSPIDFNDVNEKPLDIITKVGCSISIGCAALTLVVYFIFWRYVRRSRQSVLLVNMMIAMLTAYLLFLLGTDHSENKVACRVIAALLHYQFLAMFCIMLTMGFDLILATVRVFEHTARNVQLLLFGWGLPAIIVGITLAATQLKGYGDGRFCWLTGVALYVFIAPVLVVITVNTLFIILVMKKMHASQFKALQSVKKKITNGVKNMTVLLPVLGLTWIFGILSIRKELIVFQYIFAVLNSLQGLSVFIVHCVRNKYIHDGFKQFRRRARSTTMTETKYNISNHRTRTKTTSHSETSQ